ncbi:Cupredoxin [Russula decolorans]
MKFSLTLAAALFLPVLVNAQNQNGNVTVQVGPSGQLVYNPSNFTASNGTNVTFIFSSSSIPHSVTQGSFENPCVYLNDSSGAGFDSGLQSGKQFTIRVTNDQQPIWFYCKTTGHCGLGMVGAINPQNSGNTFDEYVAAAKALGSNAPAVTTDRGPITSGVGAVPTGTPVPTTSSSSSGSKSSSSSSSSAGHLVADGLFAFLAAAFGMTLV